MAGAGGHGSRAKYTSVNTAGGFPVVVEGKAAYHPINSLIKSGIGSRVDKSHSAKASSGIQSRQWDSHESHSHKSCLLSDLPESVSIQSQRWGRTARSRTILGTCILLVPRWAFRPARPIDTEFTSGPPKKLESNADAERRKKLNRAIEAFVNADCVHKYLRTYFRPVTDLDVYHSLEQTSGQPVEFGWQSKASQRELSWTVLDLKRSPPSDRCCGRCNPDILSRYPASDRHDARLKAFASDFLFPIPSFPRRQRMDSVSSTGSRDNPPATPTRAAFLPFTYKVQVPQQQREDLLKKLADHGPDFLREATVTPDLICKFVPWNLASLDDLKAVASLIMDWRVDAQLAIGLTPRGGHRQKQQNTMQTPPRAASNVVREAVVAVVDAVRRRHAVLQRQMMLIFSHLPPPNLYLRERWVLTRDLVRSPHLYTPQFPIPLLQRSTQRRRM
ncbi:hypothetical protein GGX14DRAFT_571796 [Mycena pura]|uniref:Uncharacterized protein n=1 Tax=Mycena pura TaxID=153505 RepID=A0AAD6V5W4_9AGAR|nr:hypothetical protein GGX14DRAFT_571796 [Mycena pura]